MSRETEKIFRDLEKFLNNREFESEEESNQAVQEFMNMQNSKVPVKMGVDAWDYLERAEMADNEEDALKYAKKALQLDKNLLDAEVIIAELTSNSIEELKKKYEKMIANAENHLKKVNILIDENIGHFWGMVETRPYMRARHAYIDLLISLGKFKKAIKECEELLVLSEGDNLGIRYKLISLYAYFEDEENVIKLYEKFNRENNSQTLLAIVALYYKLDDENKAETYLKKLVKSNKGMKELFGDIEGLLEMMMDEDVNPGMYQMNSKEEIMVSLSGSLFLYAASPEFIFWIGKHIS